MATKRRPLHSNSTSRLNFRPNITTETPTCDPRGTKPLPEPSSVFQVIVMMILHACRRYMFFDTSVKVGIYLGSLFTISLLCDVLPIPRTYFSRKDNILNVYFVKIAWGWTLVIAIPFIVLTSYTYCCGKLSKILQHLTRLAVATVFWCIWVRLFHYVEVNFGKCSVKGEQYLTKSACLLKGQFWYSLDISGHAFILVYSALVLIEESRAILGWEGIRDMMRDEEHSRSILDTSARSNPLRNLNSSDFSDLKISYEKYTPYIRGLFICATGVTLIWDVMLFGTMLYFHNMIEKLLSGIIAVSMWYVTYRVWYTIPNILPNMPGEGCFRYRDARQCKEVPIKKKGSAATSSKNQLPKFMGMPLYGLRSHDNMDDRNGVDKQISDKDNNC